MSDKISLFTANLNQTADLFEKLSTTKPKWWQIVKARPDLYIDIRKDNSLNIYYYGASLAKIEFIKGKGIVAKTHPKYLGKQESDGSDYYKRYISKKDGKKKVRPIYQDCIDILENDIESIIENAGKYYVNKNRTGEQVAEKRIQGEIIHRNPDEYIDSEFAHRLYIDKQNTIRIDLIKVVDNEIIFEELKLIDDNRMLNLKEVPEILNQMKEYGDFLKVNKDELLDYYKKIIEIKKSLELPVPEINCETLTLKQKPVLLLFNNYIKETQQRKERIEKIERILRNNDIDFNYWLL